MSFRPVVFSAILFAIDKHKDQKYGDKPYLTHLLATHLIALQHGGPMGGALSAAEEEAEQDLLVAALLHDIFEDTDASAVDLDARFGPTVTRLVWGVTTPVAGSRKERVAAMHEKLKTADEPTVFLKFCDRCANVEAARVASPKHFAMYAKEQEAFLDASAHIQSPRVEALRRRLTASFA
jgi:guanosine-3',5'-bis(diphosphate) 3'-pyrophosphohydrolase